MKLSHLLALLLLSAVVLPAGCVNAPYGMSLDRHNFGSTVQNPRRVTLIDSTNGETVWSMDVPVGQTLVMDFEQPATWTQSEFTGAQPADRVTWGLFETGETFGSLDEEVPLPSGNPVYLRVEERELEEPEIEDAEFTPTAEEPPLPDEQPRRIEEDTPETTAPESQPEDEEPEGQSQPDDEAE